LGLRSRAFTSRTAPQSPACHRGSPDRSPRSRPATRQTPPARSTPTAPKHEDSAIGSPGRLNEIRELAGALRQRDGPRYDADGGGKLLILPFKFLLFRRPRRDLPHKSGGPPLFELPLKVQRDVAHTSAPGLRSCPGVTASTLSPLERSPEQPHGIGAACLYDERGGRMRGGGGRQPNPHQGLARLSKRLSGR
jgi:hypothetical protein